MDIWNAQNTFDGYSHTYGAPHYQEDVGSNVYGIKGPLVFPVPEPSPEESYMHKLSSDDLARMKQEKRRERNRQASARYRERKEQLVAHLEDETKRMEQEVAELETRLQRGLAELEQLRAEAVWRGIGNHNGTYYPRL